MKRLAIVLLFIYFVSSCKSTLTYSENASVSNRNEIQKNSAFSITLKALNLTEDMSSLSTKNDEILLIIYDFTNKHELRKPVITRQIIFDQDNRISTVTTQNNIPKKKEYLIFLIEQDSETPIEQIDPILRIHFKKIIELYNSKDYLGLEKYIGDEDLLGVASISDFTNQKIFDFEGFHKLDRYHYNISIR